MLPESHPDDLNPLKRVFLQEPFRDLSGSMVQLRSLVGTPMVIVMFPSFKTEDGRRSLLGIERMLSMWPERFIAIFVPYEDVETVRTAIVAEPGDMMFLFRADETGNPALVDKYADLFWDAELVAADFPLDPPQWHNVTPFYWIVDSSGTIREKLIDYSNERGVRMSELEEVLEALLGPPLPPTPATQPPERDTSVYEEEEMSPEIGEESGE